jgi:hypothetical protein
MAARIRKRHVRGWLAMIEESDKGYKPTAYDAATKQYTVQWRGVCARM